jgi:hypothetical protein
MMGFLNKFMDALGVELEGSTVEEVGGVISRSGWSPGKHLDGGARSNGAPPRADGIMTRLSIVRHAPTALSLDKKWKAGVPDRWPAVGNFLRQRTGHDFPVLSRLTRRRAIRALATMLRDNLDATVSVVGIRHKLAAGVMFAQTVQNARLEDEIRLLGDIETDARVEVLARAVSPSPSRVDDHVLESCRELTPAAIIEVVTFVAVLQLVHRLESFYAP